MHELCGTFTTPSDRLNGAAPRIFDSSRGSLAKGQTDFAGRQNRLAATFPKGDDLIRPPCGGHLPQRATLSTLNKGLKQSTQNQGKTEASSEK